MVSFQQAQTGNKVYGAGGRSANMGRVSAQGAQGYMRRELSKRPVPGTPGSAIKPNRPVGNDGKSDRRSGIAQKALKGMGTDGKSSPPGPGGKKQGNGNKPKAKGRNGEPGMPAANIAPTPPPPPQVKVNSHGMLELPYNQQFAADQYAAVDSTNQELMSIQQEETQADLEAMEAQRQLDLMNRQAGIENLSGSASSGAAFSSMYGKQVADTAATYAGETANITNRRAQQRADAATRRAAAQSALAQSLMAGTQQLGVDLSEDAGNLGLGKIGNVKTRRDDHLRGKGKPKKKGGKK